MEGVRDVPHLRGIIPNSFEHVFSHINNAGTGVQFLVRASYLEIYNEEIRDLLSPGNSKLEMKEHPETGVYVKDLSTFVVKDEGEMDKLMNQGNKNRSVGFTEMNARSSRSHSIFTINIEMSEKREGKDCIRMGKLNLVDLAGSERQGKTGASGQRLKEASKINLSLSCLGNIIKALVDGKSSHIPYRDSKLTRLLQDSLGGNAKTMMIATLSPASYNYDETISTLRYASRAKNIKNKPKVNEDPKDAMLRAFQAQIMRLREQLEANGTTEPANEESGDDEPDEQSECEEGESLHNSLKDTTGARTAVDATHARKKPTKLSLEEMKEMEEDIKREKQTILDSTDMIESEKQALLKELECRQDEIVQERSKRQELVDQIEQMESKLLVGGVNILDREAQQREELAQQAADAEMHRQQQLVLKQQMEQEEDAAFQMEEEYNSLQEEAAAKTQKVKKLWTLLMKQKGELKDSTREFQREREDLLDTIRDLSRDLKLKLKLVDHFIPDEELAWIESQSSWDDINEEWHIKRATHSGNNVRGQQSGTHVRQQQPIAISLNPKDINFWMPTYPNPNIYLAYEWGGKPANTSAARASASPSKSVASNRKSAASPHGRPLAARPKSGILNLSSNAPVNHAREEVPVARGLVSKPRTFA